MQLWGKPGKTDYFLVFLMILVAAGYYFFHVHEVKIKAIVKNWDKQVDYADVLIIDLNDNGFHGLSAYGVYKNIKGKEFKKYEPTMIYFDLDDDSFAEASTWNADRDDAFLVWDRNNDGHIKGGELFGNTARNGFKALKDLDSNGDDVIDYRDKDWSKLELWQDMNLDGQTLPGEVKTLAYFGINSISLHHKRICGWNVPIFLTSGCSEVSRFGKTIKMGARRLFLNQMNSDFDEMGRKIDVEVYLMPQSRGYNNVMSLRDAYSYKTDEEKNAPDELNTLTGKMRFLMEQDTSTFFKNYSSNLHILERVLFQWTDVINIDPASRGAAMKDARILAFEEAIFGRTYEDIAGTNLDPQPHQGKFFEDLWYKSAGPGKAAIFQVMKANILTQLSPGQVWADGVYYDERSDSLRLSGKGEKKLNAEIITALKDEGKLLPPEDLMDYWAGVVDYLRCAALHELGGPKEFNDYLMLSQEDTALLDAAITESTQGRQDLAKIIQLQKVYDGRIVTKE